MRLQNYFLATAVLFLFFSCNDLPTSPVVKDTGSAQVTIVVGNVGALTKTAVIEMRKLYIQLSATGETTIYDSIALSGNTQQSITKTYSNLASLLKTWTLTAVAKDINGVMIHSGSTTFIVPAKNVINISLNLAAQYSMLKANFYPIRDSVTRCSLSIDGARVAGLSFSKQTKLGDTIKLAYDYLSASPSPGTSHTIKMDVSGSMWGFDTLLYTGQTTINVISGENKTYTITLQWVGPSAPPPGAATLTVVLGAVGTATMNGILYRTPELISTITTSVGIGAIALNLTTGILYTNADPSNRTFGIDLSTNAIVATWPTSGYANQTIAADPVRNRVYVGESWSGTLRVVDAASGTTIAQPSIPATPYHSLGVNSATNTIYIAASNSRELLVMNGTTFTINASVAVGQYIHGSTSMAIDEAGNRLFITCGDDNQAFVINGATNSIAATITGLGFPWGVAYNPATNRIFIGYGITGSDSLVAIDGSTYTVIARTGGFSDPCGVAVNPETNRVYVTNNLTAKLTVVDGNSCNILGTVDVGTNPYAVAVNPATGRIYVTNAKSGTISVVQE